MKSAQGGGGKIEEEGYWSKSINQEVFGLGSFLHGKRQVSHGGTLDKLDWMRRQN